MQFLTVQPIGSLDTLDRVSPVLLPSYNPWKIGAVFQLDFSKKAIVPIQHSPSHVVPSEVIINGESCPKRDALTLFYTASKHGMNLSQYGDFSVFTFGSYFERKNTVQSARYPSSIKVLCNKGKAEIDFTYRGDEGGNDGIANEARAMMLASGLVIENSLDINCWAVRAELIQLRHEVVDFMLVLLQRLGSGKVFEHHWSASIVWADIENANKYGFELYNRVAESGLTADEIKASFKLKFLDVRGLDVVRQLCEGETNYTIPLGTFRHRKKKAILGVNTNKDGHRLALTLKEAPTEEEWAHFESVLGMEFER